MTGARVRPRSPTVAQVPVEPVSVEQVPVQRSVVGYGGPRLQPGHYEPDWVPEIIARHRGVPDTLPPGSPGKIGILELGFARRGDGTELVEHYQKSPLQIMRPLYYDPLRPDMPYTYLMSTGAGIMQGDRLRTDLTFGPGSSAHVTTSAYTKVLKMEHDYAVAQVNLDVQDEAYVEYLPDPLIAFARSRLYQRNRVTIAESATLVMGETFMAGRLGRGERHAYTALASDLEVRRPTGHMVALDRVRLVPQDGDTGGLAVMDDRDVLSMLYVLTDRMSAKELQELLHDTLAPEVGDVSFGVSALPGEAGAWVRMVADDVMSVAHATTLAWRALRLALTDVEAPLIRKC
ncbi:urease accessory protein UreD [Nocardioides jishulii]|uniref:Urease accessory protein UreD n=1 Tax=Nocardioides jishulii TaxID=2575440 RepID=A0A4U2YMW1_9ACTN|nr:urease accessory protein UreD [Nocardioides jishulii]QCX27819.1 urease accessory protein UreD [Nocardioides jishulii]TKI62626.1 urease accessory protein UreD [Nocardioides jishulii]